MNIFLNKKAEEEQVGRFMTSFYLEKGIVKAPLIIQLTPCTCASYHCILFNVIFPITRSYKLPLIYHFNIDSLS